MQHQMTESAAAEAVVYVFNKRIKNLIGMLKADLPGNPLVSLVKTMFKTMKAMNKSYVFLVYHTDFLPRYGAAILAKEPFFADPSFSESIPMLAPIVPGIVDFYNSITQKRRDEFWAELHKL